MAKRVSIPNGCLRVECESTEPLEYLGVRQFHNTKYREYCCPGCEKFMLVEI